jgi:hypothetical protein
MSAPSKVALLAFALDPALFAEYCLSEIEPWQTDIVRNRDHDLILAHRQRGKSTGLGIKSLWESLFLPYSNILFFSASEDQAAELFRKTIAFYQPFRQAFPPVNESALRITLNNGARITVLPSKARSIRGYSAVTRLVMDEAVEVANDLYYTARPMIRRTRIKGGGKISALSNAGFDDGWFYDEYTEGGTLDEETALSVADEWRRWFIPVEGGPQAGPAPWYTEEFKRTELEKIGQERYDREFRCRFTRLKGMAAGGFSKEVVDAAFADDVSPMEWA